MKDARSTTADQLKSLASLREELTTGWSTTLDVKRARARLASGRTAFAPLDAIDSVGDLVVPMLKILATFERVGLASSTDAMTLRRGEFRVGPLAAAWLGGEPLPRDGVACLSRRVMALLGNSILVRIATDVRGRRTVTGWTRAQCPCCGGAPEFAAETKQGRRLVCSRCDTAWATPISGCLGCGATDAPTLVRIMPPAVGYALAICHSCGRYLKEPVDLKPSSNVIIDRMLTMYLDEAAERRGLRL